MEQAVAFGSVIEERRFLDLIESAPFVREHLGVPVKSSMVRMPGEEHDWHRVFWVLKQRRPSTESCRALCTRSRQ